MGDDETDDATLTSTIEEQLANEDAGDGSQTQPLSKQDLQDLQDSQKSDIAPPSDEQLAEENANTSLDQPSDSTS